MALLNPLAPRAVFMLTGLIVREVDRLGPKVKGQVEWVERELRLMDAWVSSFDAMGDKLDSDAAELLEEARRITCRIEDLISRYEKVLAPRRKIRSLILECPTLLMERRKLAIDLEEIAIQIHKVSEKGRRIHEVRSSYLPSSSSQGVAAGFHVSGSAMANLDVVLDQNWLLHSKLIEQVKDIREELVPLHNLLNHIYIADVVHEDLDKRQKVWLEEVTQIFHSVGQIFSSFLSSVGRRKCCGLLPHQFKLEKKLQKIKTRVLVASSRFYTYAIGEFKAIEGPRFILPQVEGRLPTSVRFPLLMQPFLFEPFALMSAAYLKLISETVSFSAAYLELFHHPKPLALDLELMKALFEDAKSIRDNSDQRVKVWLGQMEEIHREIKDVEEAKTVNRGRMKVCNILSQIKLALKAERLVEEIRNISARKMRYDIGSFVGGNGTLDVQGSVQQPGGDQSASLSKSKDQVELMRELDLMNALIKDVESMENLNERLKVWVAEIAGASQEATAIVKRARGFFGRMKVAGRTDRVDKWIDDISRWKRTYGITGIEARKGSALNSCMPKAAKPYPSGFVEAEVESIRREIKLMQALDADIQKILGVDEKSKIWMEEMHEAIEDAKKFFDSYDHFPIKKCMLSFHKVLSFYFFPLQDEGSNSLLELKNKIQTIFDRRTRYSVEQFNRPGNVNHGITAMLLSEEITAEKDLLIIPVIDLKVTSQSYLNELIHSSDAIINHFDRRIWVKIPEDFNPVRVLYDIEEQLKQEEKERMGNVDNPLVARPRGLEKEICTEEEELKQTLDDLLVHRRYLIVLNGIQSAEAWNCLQTYFPNASNGSRIVLITQNIDEEKWILSCQKFESEMNEEQRQKLTGKGKFQLLAPVKLGELPPKYGTVSEWERKLMQPRHVSESLDISYGSAPSYLWRCLFCLLIFPNGEEISARRLIALWVAEGIVRPKKGDSKPAEYLAESYLNQLIDLKMIEATNTKHNGKVKACMLNKNMLETLSKKAKEANFFKDQAGDSVFRLVFNPVNQNSVFCHINGDEICSSSLLRVCYQKAISFHSFDTGEASKYGDNIGNFLRRCIFNRCFASLRVLDLERVFKPKLPTALELIRSLRYLGLRWTYLESLPPRVSKLLNLEVLDIKRTYISSLPKSIWQMQYLRHLYLSETYGSQFRSRPRNRSLTNLQTLWGAFIDEDSPVLDGLDTIVNVRKLGLTCRSMSSAEDMESQLVAVRNWIWKLKKNLEHLRLKSYDTGGNPSDLQLEKLLDHDKLSSIYLLGKLRDSSVNSLFPSSLTEITLSGSELKNDPMITLEKLPNLIILRLLARSTTCMTMCCSQGGFPLLQILKIWNLEQLVEWKIEKRALLGLKKLEIRCCKNLKMLPDGLRHVETLQELMLCLMPQSFTDSIQDDQPVMWGKIKEILEVVRD